MNKPPKPRILHIASGDLWAGAEVQLYTLCSALQNSLQVPVTVILLNHGLLEKRLMDAGIQVTVLDESQLSSLQIFWRLTGIIRSTRPDVVHTHRTKENILGSIAAYFSRKTPSVRTVHGAPEHNMSRQNITKIFIWFMDWLSGRFLQSRIISVSDELAGILRKKYPARKISTIENGIDIGQLQQFKNSTSSYSNNRTDKTFRAGLACRLVPVKRADLFISTAAYMLKHYPDLKTSFHIFGEGSMRSELESLNHALGTSNIVEFEGHREDLHQCLLELDALLITSDHEGLPMILLEAMALEVPIIAHAVGGIPKVLGYGTCGILIKQQNPESYAHGIYQLAVAHDFARNLSNKALEQVTTQYSSEINARSYLSEYERYYNLLSKNTRSGINE